MADINIPRYLQYIYETEDGVVVESEGFFPEDSHYDNANSVFKKAVSGRQRQIEYYNRCCDAVLGDDCDFKGRFSSNHFITAQKRIDEDCHLYVNRTSDAYTRFFIHTFKKIIDRECKRIKREKGIKKRHIMGDNSF